MENLLPLKWFVQDPIDFEHKQYVLYGYLQKVDDSFHYKKLSPHLLHLEKMIDELMGFESSFKLIQEQFKKREYVYFDYEKIEGENDNIIYEIREIVEFAIPQVSPRINLGYKILKKNNQILF